MSCALSNLVGEKSWACPSFEFCLFNNGVSDLFVAISIGASLSGVRVVYILNEPVSIDRLLILERR